MTPPDFIQKWQHGQSLRTEPLPAAFSRPLRSAGPGKAGRRRPRRHALHVRARRHQILRRQRLGRRLDASISAGSTRGKHKNLAGSLPATAAISRGPGKPAAVGRVRSRPLRDSYQLHRTRSKRFMPSISPGWPTRRISTFCAACSPILNRSAPASPPPRVTRAGGRKIRHAWPTGCGSAASKPMRRPTSS